MSEPKIKFNDLFLVVANESLNRAQDCDDLFRIAALILAKVDAGVRIFVHDPEGNVLSTNCPDVTTMPPISKGENLLKIDLRNDDYSGIFSVIFSDALNLSEEDNRRANGFLVYLRGIFNHLYRIKKLESSNFELLKLYKFLEHINLSLEIEQLRTAIVLGLYEMINPESVSLITLDQDTHSIIVLSKTSQQTEPGEFTINSRDINDYRIQETDDDFTVLGNWVAQFWASVREEEHKDLNIQPIEVGGKKFGYISVISGEGCTFTRDDERMITAAARQIAIAVANAMLYVQSITDNLTHLYLRRYFIDRLQKELHRAQRYNRIVTLLMVDLDHFKRQNDQYGHRAGDRILAQFSAIIKSGLRDIDIPCRYGGEEFAVLLPETDNTGGRIVAERLRKQVENTEFEITSERKIRVTISIGVASFPDDAANLELLIERADKRLYQAKSQGRNRVCSEIDHAAAVPEPEPGSTGLPL